MFRRHVENVTSRPAITGHPSSDYHHSHYDYGLYTRWREDMNGKTIFYAPVIRTRCFVAMLKMSRHDLRSQVTQAPIITIVIYDY